MGFQIAIDGPSGSGKSTISKTLAKKLGYIYIDTGAMYRTVGYQMLRNNIDFDDTDKIKAELKNINIDIMYEDFVQKIYLNNEDVTTVIRTQQAAAASSKVATVEAVRTELTKIQRELANDNNVIMDGRDIGSFVLPNADLKIYLDANVDIRTMRRCKELTQLNIHFDPLKIKDEIIARDYNDMNRKHSPLQKAEDAVLLDTSDMDLDEVTKKILDIIDDKRKGRD